jgi:hypothetical protein
VCGLPRTSDSPGLGMTPRIPQTRQWKASESSIEPRNSTHVVFRRNADKLSRFAPGSKTGITRKRCSLSQTRRLIATLISSRCHGPNPSGPTKTAQLSHSLRASSIAGCQEAPGIRFHLSNQAWICFQSRRSIRWHSSKRHSSTPPGRINPGWCS